MRLYSTALQYKRLPLPPGSRSDAVDSGMATVLDEEYQLHDVSIKEDAGFDLAVDDQLRSPSKGTVMSSSPVLQQEAAPQDWLQRFLDAYRRFPLLFAVVVVASFTTRFLLVRKICSVVRLVCTVRRATARLSCARGTRTRCVGFALWGQAPCTVRAVAPHSRALTAVVQLVNHATTNC